MASPISYAVDDRDLDDAALWAVIDSAAAASLSSTTRSRKTLALKHTPNHHIPSPNFTSISPLPPTKSLKNPRHRDSRASSNGEVMNATSPQSHCRPQKMARSCVSELTETSPPAPLAVVKHVYRTPTAPSYSSLDIRSSFVEEYGNSNASSECTPVTCDQFQERDSMRHSLSGRFPSVALFKEYQNAAMAILEKCDYTLISGTPFIKKSGWRKISCYFNISYELKDKTIEFDENRNVQRAEFVVRAHMQGGRFSDGWGSCERREKRFSKPNNDIPSTAETRAKNRACQDLLGIGEYKPGANQTQR